MNIEAFLAAKLAQPITHIVVTKYADGAERSHSVRSMGAAENYATGERRKIGRDLISRDTGATVRVVSVEVVAA
ncbi:MULTISPECIES: hypothetical protein [unclassified Aurantimonas]|uniref:hypothetical protein n=1 Tax=unclassified Aurantimonas TaxID=2638230 RepID=UPI002E1967E3|nr:MULTISPECIES: hypothetical protein [unclassified Aurantimonas]MEC5289402.1 hypothetical protein [Aurantimonas sp. C2-3-R2]MEC5410482.1 hypothetical protein [Aurantimonas sp. C2-4-R8]